MNYGIDSIIGIAWFIEAVIMFGLAIDTYRLSRSIDGSILRWPISGRDWLAAAFFVMGLRALDVTRIRLRPEWLERYASSDASTLTVAVIRILVPLVLIIVWRRLRNGGLVRGRNTSVPHDNETDVRPVVRKRRHTDWYMRDEL